MRTILFFLILPLFIALGPLTTQAQGNTSNKGTEFWTAYMDHISSIAGNQASQMSLYITSDVNTTGTVSIADGSFSAISFTITANKVTILNVPSAAFLTTEGKFNKGVHIVSAKPIVVYAHIYASSVSGATLVLPVSTLSKDYYSINYTQKSNTNPAYSAFIVIGTEDGTTVEITPAADLNSGNKAGKSFQITLNKGELYQGLSATDLTGTRIKSISTTTGTCKKIAVYSGSSKVYIGSPNTSADNLFQQVYPTSSWGKNYITAPLKGRNYDVFRITISDPNTVVTLNGTIIPSSSFTNGFYYEFNSQRPNTISADKPILVAQYAVTSGNGINGSAFSEQYGDPEMIYLNPLEQSISNVTLYSTPFYKIITHFINVVIKTSAVSSFTLDGATASGNFSPVPGNATYSYAQLSVSEGTHNISASEGFNAIAYGFGGTESYGYAAGTNLLDLNEYISLQDPQTNLNFSSGCTGLIYQPQIRLPYQTSSLQWELDGTTEPPITNPVYDHTETKDNKTLYVYNYPKTISYPTGDHSIIANVFNPTSDECGSLQEITLNFSVVEPPAPSFTRDNNSCFGQLNTFTDKSDAKGSVIKTWKWDFGDGQIASTAVAKHTYDKPGDYSVVLTVTNQTGCVSSSAPQIVHIAPLPVAAFTFSTPGCEAQDVTFTDASTTAEGKITSWVWDFGDGTTPVTKTDGSAFTYKFAKAGTYQVSLKVTTLSGCISVAAMRPIIISPTPNVDFDLPTVCLQNATGQFTDKTTITGTTGKPFKYLWNFDDPNATPANPNTSALANPTHQFTAAGVYHVLLTVTSNDVCIFSKQKDYTVSGKANFSAPASACPADVITFTDKTETTPKAVTAWQWDFGDGDASTLQSPQHAYKKSGDYTVILTVTGNNGCSTTSYAQPIHITPLPLAGFKVLPPNCETTLITFNDAATTAEGKIINWLWDFGDGTSPLLKTDNSPVTHLYTSAGTYTATLKVTGSTGCISDVFQRDVIVHPLPVVSFTLPDACVKDFSQFNNASSIADHTESEFTYLWNFGDGAATLANNTSTLANPKHKYSTAGVYNITLTVTSKYGCSVTSPPVKFTVNGSLPKAEFKMNNTNSYCSADEVKFDNLAAADFGSITKIELYYDFDNHPDVKEVYTKSQIPADGIFRHSYGMFTSPAIKTFTVHMIAYSGDACISNIFELRTPNINANPAAPVIWPAPFCQEAGKLSLSYQPNVSGSALFTGTGIVDKQKGIFDPAVSGPGTFTINYVFTADNNCQYLETHDITVYATPSANAGGAITMLEGGTTTINATASSNVISYQWTLANGKKATGLSADNVLRPIASPANDTEYMLTVTTANGCTKSSNVKITVLKAPIVPNTFTPNNDGINDTWQIKYLETYPNCTIDVYNRYGEKVYSSVGYAIPWNGIYKGAYLPVGTYYYIINPQNGRKVITGSITIIK